MGTSYFAVPILKSLYQNGYPISVVYTQPPKKSNRGQKLNKSPINLFSENISLDVRTPQTLKNNNEEELYLRKLQTDLIVVVSYGQIIPKNLLNITIQPHTSAVQGDRIIQPNHFAVDRYNQNPRSQTHRVMQHR